MRIQCEDCRAFTSEGCHPASFTPGKYSDPVATGDALRRLNPVLCSLENDMSNSEPPIILIGMPRSGTTWLGDALSQAADVAYWKEPRQVWCYGNYFQPDDVLTEEHATDRVKNYIRRRFAAFTLSHGALRFCEKTPSNCLRIRFVHEVFPDAKFIFLIRDGRAVFQSSRGMQEQIITWKRIRARITESSVREFPAFLQTLPGLWSKILGRPLQHWGIRPPGWKKWPEYLTPNQITARQWADSMEIALRDMKSVPDGQRISSRYEELMADPVFHGGKLVDFLGIKDRQSVERFIRETARPARAAAWNQEIAPQCLEEIRPITEPALLKLGYSWEPK